MRLKDQEADADIGDKEDAIKKNPNRIIKPRDHTKRPKAKPPEQKPRRKTFKTGEKIRKNIP